MLEKPQLVHELEGDQTVRDLKPLTCLVAVPVSSRNHNHITLCQRVNSLGRRVPSNTGHDVGDLKEVVIVEHEVAIELVARGPDKHRRRRQTRDRPGQDRPIT
jgi:hypothetical protein